MLNSIYNRIINNDNLFFRSIVFFLIIYAIVILTFWDNHLVCRDIVDFQSKLDSVFVKDFWNAFKNNTLLLYVLNVFKSFNILSIANIQVFSIILISTVLLKKIKPYYVVLIFLIVFNDLLCNQFRQSIALSLFFLVYLYEFKNKQVKLVLYVSSFLTHFFAVAIVSSLFVLKKYDFFLKHKKRIAFSLYLLVLAGVFLLDKRLSFYLIPTSNFISLKFVLCFSLLLLNKSFLQTKTFNFFLILSFVCLFVCFLPSFSTRLSELVLIMLIVTLGKYDLVNDFRVKWLNFLLAFGYFMFCVVNIWVVKRDLMYKIFQNLV